MPHVQRSEYRRPERLKVARFGVDGWFDFRGPLLVISFRTELYSGPTVARTVICFTTWPIQYDRSEK